MKQTHSVFKKSILSISLLLALAGCETAREQFAGPRSPDEFAVIRRAPLEMPPEYASLPKPQKGAARPQEMAPIEMAEKTLIPNAPKQTSVIDQSSAVDEILTRAGANQADPNIRYTIEEEHMALVEKEKPTVDRLLGKVTQSGKTPARIVDAEAEYERIKQNRANGVPVNQGESPYIDIKQ